MCGCPGFTYRQKCKHTTLTPAERAKEKREAAKHGKATAEMLHSRPEYASVADKVDKDPKLADFLNNV